ncbi:unnamed protein product [Leptidea sinapis]|uniref:Uncharacterized protein n=1 Tax=Leptidea sinapis TaxID=189913 RepID=A0A5E4Q9C5_9NEOP|nr:unnamed protein product [Leptidea sinapis]
MKNRSLAGNCGIAVFVIALVTVALAFGTPNWLVSDPRMRGAKMERLGLWSHCFRSLPDPLDQYQRRFFVGCRWESWFLRRAFSCSSSVVAQTRTDTFNLLKALDTPCWLQESALV